MSGTDKDIALGRENNTRAAYDTLIADGSYVRTRLGFWDRLGLTPIKTALRLLLRNKGTDPTLKIVDVGCGAGHDMALFRSELEGGVYNGRLDISGIDPCEGMCAHCRSKGLTVFQGGVLDCAELYRNSALIWSNMALIHLPLDEFPNAVRKLAVSLVPRGILGLGFKASHGEDHEMIDPPDDRINVERFTAFHKVSSVCKLLESCNVKVTASILIPSENNPSYSYAWVFGENWVEEEPS
jgi:SAM-dependent methyltransferase